ncbi:MAG: hypothetical protein IBJ00_00460 [Alphaproteobacteria bacterium]|nr:hypothetical protein [Alphaproteobacteria bacterium]
MERKSIWQKLDQYFHFSFFYLTLFSIFFVSFLTLSHILITIPILSTHHMMISNHGLFYTLYLTSAGLISAHDLWSIFLQVTSVIASIAAATYSIYHLYNNK